MPVATELSLSREPGSGTRPVFRPSGNGVRVSEFSESKRKKEVTKKPRQPKRLAIRSSESIPQNDVSVYSTCSSGSSCSVSSVKMKNFRRRMRHKGLKSVKIVPDGVEISSVSSLAPVIVKRCDWITPNSDPLYASFHDEEWGVPVYDDKKLFELLVLSEALAELSWPTILNKRQIIRKHFDNFDPESIALFTDKKISSLKASVNTLLSEQKLRAVVENARQILRVQEEFGSFSNYCWSFVNHKPVKNGFRYKRQVPAKTPKAEAISKDMIRRGFRCVGPTVIYSFMQVVGIVNDHLLTCFRYEECNRKINLDLKAESEETGVLAKTLEKTCLSHGQG